MEQSVKNLIGEVESTYNEISKLSKDSIQYIKQGKKGDAQNCLIRSKYLHRKLLGLKQQLTSLVKGNVAYIKYNIFNKQNLPENHEAMLINMSDSDIHTTLELYCRVNEFKFNKVLEIKRISTKLG